MSFGPPPTRRRALPPSSSLPTLHSKLNTQIDLFRHREHRVALSDRLERPLPLDVSAAGPLVLSCERLHTRMGAEATPAPTFKVIDIPSDKWTAAQKQTKTAL